MSSVAKKSGKSKRVGKSPAPRGGAQANDGTSCAPHGTADIAQPGELAGLRAIAKAAEAIFDTHGDDPYVDVALNALMCTKQDIEDLSYFAQLLRQDDGGTPTKDPALAFERVALRIDLAIALANHQFDIQHAAEAVAS